MAIIKCKMCGGDIELSPEKTFGTCEYCGSTMTLPNLDDDQRAARFNRGNHFRRIGEFDKALAIYEQIVQEDDTDAEAHWCCALCRFGIEYVEDPATFEYIPTCHRASFDSILEDVDYLAAVEHSYGLTRRQYQKDAVRIADVQRGILSTVQQEEPFDIFICYKESDDDGNRTVDSTLAQDIYFQLTEQGRRVFFSRITLEDKAGQEFEPYIFAALHSAKVMIVVGTKAEYLNAVWVKNEWSRYLALMKSDRKRLLIPCYRDMDPYDMPEQLSVLQSYDMSKIGFIQDLIRGVGKVLDAEKPKETIKETVKETVVMQGESGVNINALLKRGNMALEDKNWEGADSYFDRVLDMNAECAEAFLGKALSSGHAVTLNELLNNWETDVTRLEKSKTVIAPIKTDEARIEQIVQNSTVPGYLNPEKVRKLFRGYEMEYRSDTDARQTSLIEIKKRIENNKHLVRAIRYADNSLAESIKNETAAIIDRLKCRAEESNAADIENEKRLQNAYESFLDQQEQKVEDLCSAAKERRESDYQGAVQAQEKATIPSEYLNARSLLLELKNYKDAQNRAEQCRKAADELYEAERKAYDAAHRRKKNIITACSIAGVLIIGAVLLTTKVIIPEREYRSAERFFVSEQYDDAIMAFEALGTYKDSADRVTEVIQEKENATAYEKAEELITAGLYKDAINAFDILGDYRDSQDKSKFAAYQIADKLFTSGQYFDAVAAFNALDDYSDSIERAAEAFSRAYGEAEELANENPGKGAIAFSKIGDYGGAKEKGLELWEKSGVHSLSAGGATRRDTSGHTVAKTTNGTVLAIGCDLAGQCQISDWKDIVSVAAGGYHTVGLRSDGTVIAVGGNGWGQCEVSSWTDIIAIAAGELHTVGLRADGTVVAAGYNEYSQCELSDWTDIVAITAGKYHTVGLRADGTVLAVGNDATKQCRVSDWTDIIAIAAGSNYTVALRAEGTVIAIGSNGSGQCDVSDWADIVSISSGGFHTIGLKSDGTVIATGSNSYGQCNVSGWTDIVEICGGNLHTIGLKSDGTVVAVGDNQYKQCKVSDWTDIAIPNK